MQLSIYVVGNELFIPTMSRTQAGFLETEPVLRLSLASSKLSEVLKEAFNRGNPEIPTPSRANFPKPVMLKYTGAKSWKKLSEIADLWELTEHEGTYMLARGSTDANGAFWGGKKKPAIPVDARSGEPDTKAIIDAILSGTPGRRLETLR